MPRLTRWHIKAGIIFFILALGLALAFRLQPVLHFSEDVHLFRPVYYHALMVGWITQIIIGVSIWMFPRHSRETPRGSDVLGWTTFCCLNTGLLLRMIAEPLITTSQTGFIAYMIFFSGVLQWLAALAYTANIWQRIRVR